VKLQVKDIESYFELRTRTRDDGICTFEAALILLEVRVCVWCVCVCVCPRWGGGIGEVVLGDRRAGFSIGEGEQLAGFAHGGMPRA
jgi:hypothetical protein